MEQLKFIGKNLTKEKLEQAETKVLDDIIISGEWYKEGELEKTEFEKEMILLADVILENEFERLNLNYNHFIPDEHIHIISDKFAKEDLPTQASAVFDSYEQQICAVRRENESKIKFFHDLLHEMVHSVSHIKYEILEDDIKNYRTGYALKNHKDNIKYLESFNEALTEDLTQSLLFKNRQVLYDTFNIKKLGIPNSYSKDNMIIDNIVIGLSDNSKIPEHLIRDRFYKGLFTGDMMHLREIDKVFGEGSLRLLAFLDAHEETELVHTLYRKYFDLKYSDEERYNYAEQILKLLTKGN